MTAIVDALKPVLTILLADSDVLALVGTRVFGEELPRDETDSMPRKAVVIDQNGGAAPGYATTLPLEVQRLDVFCYGETIFEAGRVRRAVFGALKGITRQVTDGVLIHWVNPAGGAITGRDPDADWPVHWNSWVMSADTLAAA